MAGDWRGKYAVHLGTTPAQVLVFILAVLQEPWTLSHLCQTAIHPICPRFLNSRLQFEYCKTGVQFLQ